MCNITVVEAVWLCLTTGNFIWFSSYCISVGSPMSPINILLNQIICLTVIIFCVCHMCPSKVSCVKEAIGEAIVVVTIIKVDLFNAGPTATFQLLISSYFLSGSCLWSPRLVLSILSSVSQVFRIPQHPLLHGELFF